MSSECIRPPGTEKGNLCHHDKHSPFSLASPQQENHLTTKEHGSHSHQTHCVHYQSPATWTGGSFTEACSKCLRTSMCIYKSMWCMRFHMCSYIYMHIINILTTMSQEIFLQHYCLIKSLSGFIQMWILGWAFAIAIRMPLESDWDVWTWVLVPPVIPPSC